MSVVHVVASWTDRTSACGKARVDESTHRFTYDGVGLTCGQRACVWEAEQLIQRSSAPWVVFQPMGPGQGMRLVGPFWNEYAARAFTRRELNDGGVVGLLNPPAEALAYEEETQ